METPSIHTALDEIEAALRERFERCDVQRFPDDPGSYVLPSGRRSALLVRRTGRRFSDPASDLPRHVMEIRVEIAVLARALQRKGREEGAETLVDEACQFLEGRLAGGFALFPDSDAPVDHSDGVWRYAIELVGYFSPRADV